MALKWRRTRSMIFPGGKEDGLGEIGDVQHRYIPITAAAATLLFAVIQQHDI